MKRNNSDRISATPEAIEAFWQWFSLHHSEIENLLDQKDTSALARRVNAAVNLLSPQIAWEIGPGLVSPYMLALPPEGDASLRGIIDQIMQAAPKIQGWEFHSSRPVRPFQPEIRLPEMGLTLQTSDWQFSLEPTRGASRLELHVYDDRLAAFDEKIALTAVFILLDAVLGEDMVEKWVGDIRVYPSPLPGRSTGLHLMPSIASRLGDLTSR
jgi:hypothetical protein